MEVQPPINYVGVRVSTNFSQGQGYRFSHPKWGTSFEGDSWMYPDPNLPLWEVPKYKPYIVGIYGL